MDFIERLISFLEANLLLSSCFCILLFLCLRYEQKRSGPKISTQQAIQLMNIDEAFLVDIRKIDEFEAGHIVHSHHIPLEQFKNNTNKFPKDKNHPIIITCQMGHYSGSSAIELRKMGYTQVMTLKGGISQWKVDGLPLMKSQANKKQKKSKQKKSEKKNA